MAAAFKGSVRRIGCFNGMLILILGLMLARGDAHGLPSVHDGIAKAVALLEPAPLQPLPNKAIERRPPPKSPRNMLLPGEKLRPEWSGDL